MFKDKQIAPVSGESGEIAKPYAYLGAVGVVLVAIGVAFLLHRLMPHANLSLLFLTGVLIISARTGLGPSLVASILSFLAYNFFFTPPHYTFEVADDGDVATLLFFLAMAAITGNLAARMYREMAERRMSLQWISNLYTFSRRMSSAAGTTEVVNALADHLGHSLDRSIIVLIANADGQPVINASAGEFTSLPDDIIQASWGQKTPEVIKIAPWNLLKIISNGETVGLVAIYGEPLDTAQLNLARSLCEQAAIALDRTQLVTDLEQARLTTETEQLRSALLSSVSHDLRTPLASIIGSATSLLEYGSSFSTRDRRELMETVVAEAQRLDRHIQNLLDMTRLGQGSLSVQRDWVDLHDIIASAVERLHTALKGVVIDIEISAEIPLLWLHGILIEQALVNLLDNAIHFSPERGHVAIAARIADNYVEIDVCDDGPGIPEHEREMIFDMFYSVHPGDRDNRHGTGLGLAICRGMITAHDGTVTANDGADGHGTCMRIKLPIVQPDTGKG